MSVGWRCHDNVAALAAALVSVCCIAMTGAVSVMYFNGFIDVFQYIAFLLIFLGSNSLMLCAARTTEEDLASELRGLRRKLRNFLK